MYIYIWHYIFIYIIYNIYVYIYIIYNIYNTRNEQRKQCEILKDTPTR